MITSLLLIHSGSVTDGHQLADRARRRADPIDDTMTGSTVAWVGGGMNGHLGNPRKAQDWYTHELVKPRTARSANRRAILHQFLSVAYRDMGELATARAYQAEANAEDEGLPLLAEEAKLLFFEGQWELADKWLTAHAERVRRCGNRQADPQFNKAIATFREYCLPWEEADTLQYWGRALLAAGEHARAIEKFDAAIEIYRSRGAGARFIEYVMADRMRAQGSQSTDAEVQPPGTDSDHAKAPALTPQLQASTSNDRSRGDGEVDTVFRREGDIWTITYEGQTLRLRDFEGLSYIACLLEHPGEEISRNQPGDGS